MVDRLPREVTAFITKHIHGLSQLELLLYVHGRSDSLITAQMAAREQKMGEEQAAALLHDLHSRGLLLAVEQEGTGHAYRYQPATESLAKQVDAVARVFPTYRHAIIQLIFSKPSESVTNFAAAFLLRKDDKDG